ncbi:FKBP-type peptidyl-prolyl cis-trans isomerase [Pedococcus sp. 5OH_020]|uniref:FKBP-type peptidyl-prolyl cis-trans isomerase n=1 Tax=Pedococcus sp. 5OH_020 TaxID=2989814 RepID=UPI0022E9CB8F|nr:FKBP-type peptidyl-prolyl cis-trans isomerase [Pedococcus sp. 5OH_020]
MHLRSSHAFGAAALAAALTLTACGGGKESKGSPLDHVTVSGGSATSAPTVAVKPKPLSVTETTTRVVKPGTGSPVKDDEIVSLKYVLLNGKDSSVLDTNFGKQNLGLSLGATDLLPGLKKGLANAKIGSRILVAMPPKDAFGTQGNADIKVGPNDTVVFLMDVLSATTPLKSAQGTPVAPAAGLPSVKVEDGKAATITIPKGKKPPTKTVGQVLVQGQGAKVQAGQTIRVTYTGALWKNGKVFDSSANSPQKYFETVIGKQQVIKAWDAQLVGRQVGSRLLLVVPPAEGYGAAGSPPKISGTDTLVFVVDILAAY